MMTAILNHLWQSTLFAAVMALTTLAFRSNRARVRHAIWLAASLKFLIPFSLLVSLGSQVEWRKAPPAIPAPVAIVIDDLRTAPVIAFTPQPFKPAPAPPINWPLAIWIGGCAAFSIAWLVRWLQVRAIVRAATPLDVPIPIRASQSSFLFEPGVYGIFRPTLLLPVGIAERLSPSQLDAVIQHELCHVQRRDNLIAVIQMSIETVFWFHPPVWWIGKRLIAERERACDEAVVQSGSAPQVYAEAILNVCKLYLESPMPCVAGVTGAGLKQRIEAIVSNRIGGELNRAKKLALAAAAIAIVGAPIAIGFMNAPAMRAQSPDAPKNVPKWEAVSIRPCDSNGDPGRSGGNAKGGAFDVHLGGRGPGRMNINCQTPMQMMQQSYGPFSDGRRMSFRRATFEGAPAWTNAERFAIEGKAETPEGRIMMQGPMMQHLLADRFKLKIRRETREIPVYNLVVLKPGSKFMTRAKPGGCTPLNMEPGGPFPDEKTKLCEIIGRGVLPGEAQGKFQGYGFTMDRFAEQLGALVGRPVIDKTGLSGTFDIEVPLPLEDLTMEKDPHGDGDRYRDEDMIYAAIRHLGMKLESTKGPGIVYVIESIEHPTDNFAPPQAEEKPVPRFEVASIKPCSPDHDQTVFGSMSTGPGRLSTGCALLAAEGEHTGLIQRSYVRYANGVYHPFGPHGLLPIEGAPAWVHSEFFAIEAKAATPETPEMMQGPMMQRLLEERFKLKVHRETREGPVYNLTLVKSKMRPFKDGSCTSMPVPGMPRVELREGDHFCKFLIGNGSIDAEGSTVSEFIALLNMAVDRQVVDKTGLSGRFNIHLDFTRLQNDTIDTDADHPSIFTAVQQQLGLKLEAGRGPNEFLVIDHVEKPTEN